MLASRSLAAFGSALVTAAFIAGLISAGLIASEEKRKASKAITTIDLAALKGSEETVDAQTPSEPVNLVTNASPPPTPPVTTTPVQPALAIPRMVSEPAPAQIATATASAAASPHAPTASTATSADPPAPAKTAAPVPHGVADRLALNVRPGMSRAYAARVRSWLLAHKIYPRYARMRRLEGVVRVHFVLDREGRLIDGELVGRSGESTLDSEGEAMLLRASPYPSAPPEIAGDRIAFTAAIEFKLDP